MMRSYLRRLGHEALDRRLAKLETIRTPEAAADYQRTLKEFFFATIGQLPERTPLNTRITGRAERDGYRVENVVFESQPGFFVTANLYLPAVRGPHPGILLQAPQDPKANDWQEHVIVPSIECVIHSLGAGDFDGDGDVDIAIAEMHQGTDPDEVTA